MCLVDNNTWGYNQDNKNEKSVRLTYMWIYQRLIAIAKIQSLISKPTDMWIYPGQIAIEIKVYVVEQHICGENKDKLRLNEI